MWYVYELCSSELYFEQGFASAEEAWAHARAHLDCRSFRYVVVVGL